MVEVMGWALIRFVWQGAIAGAAIAGVLALSRRSSPQVRYAIACLGLVLMASLPLITVIDTLSAVSLVDPARPDQLVAGEVQVRVAGSLTSALTGNREGALLSRAQLERWLPAAVFVWMAGVALLSLRVLGGWVFMQRLRRRGAIAAAEVRGMVDDLSARLRLSRPVLVLESVAVKVPTVIGSIRPVILLPVSMLAGLRPEQVESILAHELAHIRRHDYMVNLFQAGVEMLLFYHPAVWYVSGRIRIERENCCDDIAVGVCGDRVAYAAALAELEELRSEGTVFAMQATGGSLLTRVRRQLGLPTSHDRRDSVWIAAGIVALMVWAWRDTSMTSSPVVEAAPLRYQVPATATVLVGPLLKGEGHISWSDDTIRYDIKFQGEVWLSDDETMVSRLSPNAFVLIAGRRPGGAEKLLTIRADSQGNIASIVPEGFGSVDEGRQWLAGNLPTIVRRLGLGVANRVARTYQKSGIAGVLSEIPLLKTDYLRRIYSQHVIEQPGIDGSAIAQVLVQAGSLISSDHEMVELLSFVDDRGFTDRQARGAYFEAMTTIGSDYELRTILTHVSREPLDEAPLILALQASRGISSSHELAQLLLAISRTQKLDAGPLGTWFLARAAAISSDHELAELLMDLGQRSVIPPGLRPHYLGLIDRIGSAYERSRVLAAIGQ